MHSENTKEAPKYTAAQWWRATELGKKPHEILDNVCRQIEDDQIGRYEAYREYEKLFGSAVSSSGDDSFRSIATDEVTQNELQNTIETLHAQIFKNRVVPAVSVSDADWDEWDRARSYGRWLEGALDTAKVYEEVWPQAGIHCLVHGTGIVRVGWEEDGESEKTAKIKVWAVNPKYVTVDRLEAKHGRPRNIYFKDHIDRFVLYDTYKESREDFFGTPQERMQGIMDCTSNDDRDLGTENTTRCDMLTVREAFHLPSGPKAKDGRHTIWVRGCTLVDEPYEWNRLPATFIRFGCRMEGFWGESAVRRLAPTQKLMDKLTKKLDESQDVMGVPRILVRKNAGIIKSHIDDIPGGILEVENMGDVKEWNAATASAELYQDRDACPRKMRGLLGISDFESSQQIPQGMRDVSGEMLERWVDQGQARHAMTHGEFEAGVMDLAELMTYQAEELQDMGYKVSVCSPADGGEKSSIEQLEFDDVCIDRKRMKLRVQSMSQLPQTFAGKVEAFEKLAKSGVQIDQKTILRQMEIPDISGTTDLLVSDEEIIFKNLTHMCKTGQYLPPMPFDNLVLIIQMTTRYINRYRVRHDADSFKVALMAQYIDDAKALQNGLNGADPNAPPSPQSTLAALGMGPMAGVPGAQIPPQMAPPMAGQMPPPGPVGPPPMQGGPQVPQGPPMM